MIQISEAMLTLLSQLTTQEDAGLGTVQEIKPVANEAVADWGDMLRCLS